MSEHVGGTLRDQTILFPDTLDQYVDKENPVRFIDAFVDSLNLEKLGFKHAVPCDTGRPFYNPSDLRARFIFFRPTNRWLQQTNGIIPPISKGNWCTRVLGVLVFSWKEREGKKIKI